MKFGARLLKHFGRGIDANHVGGETARQRLRETACATAKVQDGAYGTLAEARRNGVHPEIQNLRRVIARAVIASRDGR